LSGDRKPGEGSCGAMHPAVVPGSRLPVRRSGLPGSPATAPCGFTLIEILVVIVIIGVLALAVTIGIATAGGERQLTREAERMQALVDHACIQAELSGREIGVRLDAGGYAFATLGFDGWMADQRKDELRPRVWVAGMSVELMRDGHPLQLAGNTGEPPQIVCFSSGELSPFVLRLRLGDIAAYYELRGESDGRIALVRIASRT